MSLKIFFSYIKTFCCVLSTVRIKVDVGVVVCSIEYDILCTF